MEMAYRERWQAEIAELQKILSGFDLREECKWGKPCYTMDGKNVIIIQGFKEYCALGFFQGALLKDPNKLLVQLGQVQAARVMKFTSAKEIATKAATIKAYMREAVAAAKARLRVETKPPELPVPAELKEKFRKDPRFKRAFEALTPVANGDTCFTSPARSSQSRGPRGSRRRCLRSSKDEDSWSGGRPPNCGCVPQDGADETLDHRHYGALID